MKAVLTGDIVNSTSLESATMEQLVAEIKLVFAVEKHEFFRGDSFQAYFEHPETALRAAVLCRTAAIRFSTDEMQVDSRVAVGLGEVELPVGDLATARGEAFLLSGRSLDAMGKSDGKISVVTAQPFGAIALEVLSDYANSLVNRLTQKQAEVIHQLLFGLSQQQVSEKLNRSKSTISQHVNAADWEALQKLIVDYEKLIQLFGTN